MPDPIPHSWRPALLRYGPPAAAFLLAWAVFSAVVLAGGFPYTAENFSKWDATLYQSIARKGYEFFPCAGQSMWGGQSWCGNTGWLPLFPWLTAAIGFVLRSLPIASMVLTAGCFYAVLLLVWTRLLEADFSAKSLVLLGIAAFFPGALYYIVPYPITLFLLFTLLAFESVVTERWLRAGVWGGLAAMTYSTGLVLVGVFGLYLLITGWRWPIAKLARAIAITCGLTAAGLALVLLYFQIRVGHWDAFFQVQAKYGYGLHDPVAVFLEKIVAMFRGEYRGREEFQGFQHLLVSGWVLCLLVIVSKNRPTPRELLSLIYGVAFWVFPMVVGSGALLWRAESLLLPTVVLGRRLSIPALSVFLATSVLLCGELSLQYFKNWLP